MKVPKFKRKLYETTLPHEYGKKNKMKEVSRLDKATLVSSEIKGSDLHAPVIDLDIPCELIPSATPGHFHLYINHPIPWDRYKKLLDTLAWCGLVELGYTRASKARGASYVRSPKALQEKRDGNDKAGEVVATLNGLKPINDGSGEWQKEIKDQTW